MNDQTKRLADALRDLLLASEHADETGYVDGEGWLPLETIQESAHAALAAYDAQPDEVTRLKEENERLREKDRKQHEELAQLQAEWKGVQQAAVDDDPESTEKLDEWVRRVLNERDTLRARIAELEQEITDIQQ